MKVTEEAIEAAAQAIASANLRCRSWGEMLEEMRDHIRRDAKAALEAAAQHMLADAWDEGFEGAQGVYHQTNPYRSAQ